MLSSPHISECWRWPADRALVLYHWRWFDSELSEVVSGWSRQREADDAGYVDLEADALHEPRTRHIHPKSRRFVVVEPYTFIGVTSLPPLLMQGARPQAWIRNLLSADT